MVASGVIGPASFWEVSKCEGPRGACREDWGEPTQSRLRAAAGSGERKTLAGSREGVFSGTHWNLESFPKALLGFWVPPLGVGYGLGTYFKTL